MTLRPKGQPNSRDQPSQQQRSSKWVEKQALKDNMNNSQRGGEIVGVIVIGLVALFFYAHQTEATGFFTSSSFGATEALLLYGAILIGVAGPMARFLTGRRNKSRPPELIASVFWIVASAWFLMVVFPFDFAHFADVVPDFLAFLVSWITNDIARVLLAIGMVGGIVSVGINTVLYIKVRALLQQSGGRVVY